MADKDNVTKLDAKPANANGFAGHVQGYSLGSDMRFELRNKKDKTCNCVLAKEHPLFNAIAETIAHAHWADRKIFVSGEQGEHEQLRIQSVSVGDAMKPAKPKAAGRKQKTEGVSAP